MGKHQRHVNNFRTDYTTPVKKDNEVPHASEYVEPPAKTPQSNWCLIRVSSEGVQNFRVKITVEKMKKTAAKELKLKSVKSVANGWTKCECGELLDLRSDGKRRRDKHEARTTHTVPFHLYLRVNLPCPSNGYPCLQTRIAAAKIIRQEEAVENENIRKSKLVTTAQFICHCNDNEHADSWKCSCGQTLNIMNKRHNFESHLKSSQHKVSTF